jgi:hypothetical protein
VRTAEYTAESVHVVFEATTSLAERVRNRVQKEFNCKIEKV